MIGGNLSIRRLLTSVAQRKDIGQVFIQEDVQKMLKEITRFDEKVLFRRRQVARLQTPKLMFMTDNDLRKAKEAAYDQVKARLQMPPVMSPNTRQPEILSKDEEIIGYTKFKVMFVDISPGFSDRNRLMSVRQTDGTLREPTFEERARLNHMFYPGESRTLDVPRLFNDEHLYKVLKRGDYEYVLNRACVQFEPDDPRYVEITSKVYNYIDEKGHYDILRSTRHFGPMCLYLAFNKRADNLIVEMLSKGFIEDAAKLVKIYNTCHNIE